MAEFGTELDDLILKHKESGAELGEMIAELLVAAEGLADEEDA